MAQPATADSPQIVITYHVDDEKWQQRVVTHLGLAKDKFGILLNPVRAPQSSEYVETLPPKVLAPARALIVLVSPNFMASTWIASAQGFSLLEGLSRVGLRVFVVFVQDVPMKDSSILRAPFLLPVNLKPIADESVEKQNAVLAQLAREVIAVLEAPDDEPSRSQPLPISHLTRFEMSPDVLDALARARRLATTALVRPAIVSSPCLLFGLSEGGRRDAERYKTEFFLWNELNSNRDGRYARLLTEEFPRLGERVGVDVDSIHGQADLLSPNAFKVFEFAERISRVTSRWYPNDPTTREIGSHHVLAALLMVDLGRGAIGAVWPLSRLVGQLPAFRQRTYDFIVRSHPADRPEAWKTVLIDGQLPEVPEGAQPEQQLEPTAEVRFQQPTVAGFLADEWNGRDLLGIECDVNALSSLVAAYKVEPPLSIGLFGDWGSGKSHFMRQMRKRVELLSERARESGKPQNELGYYKNIVQIEFNAWHYIEGNLWASLVDHIFANLKLSEKEPRKFADARRDELMQKLGVKEEIQERINSKVEEREDELRKLNERKEQAEAELRQASTQLKGFREEVKANLKTLSIPVTFTAEEKQLLSRLGIETGSAITAADVHKNYLELRRGWNSVKAKWKLFRTDKRVVRRYSLSALLAAFLIGGPVLLKYGVFPRLPTIVVSILGVAGTLLAAAKPAWEQFQRSLKALEKHDQEVERERQKRITELENEVSALTQEVVAAKLESETVGKEIAKLKADIENTSSSRILAEFIEDRAAASDYRRHLGLLALIRRDFEKLRDLFEQQRWEEEEGIEVDDKKKINRIVLYIDDLDRCPPDRVVQVLQAIHLLLAFPLFVVVVGVDSRWITRSLQQNYEWLREVNEQLMNDETNATEQREENQKTGATPHDYLEKIFQIPFWLRSMNDDACVEFLDGLTRDAVENVAPRVESRAGLPGTQAARSEARVPVTISSVEVQAASELDLDALRTMSSAISQSTQVTDIDSSTAREKQNNGEQARRPAVAEVVELAPRSLTFSNKEIEFMKALVPLIGRSPRAVKRFLNCYRLIKVGLTPAESGSFIGEDGESQGYKAAMILLGVITGTPAVSSYVIDHLKTWRPEGVETTVETWANVFARDPDVRRQPDAERLIQFFKTHDFNPRSSSELLIKEMVNYVPRVSRFSFRLNHHDPFRR